MDTPSHSIEAEKSVLGALLLDRNAMLKVADLLSADDFYDPRHATVFSGCMSLFTANKPIDLVTLSAELEGAGDMEKVGSRADLAALTEELPSTAHVLHHARIIKEHATRRHLSTAGRDIAALSSKAGTDVSLLLEQSESRLFAVTQQLIKDKFVPIRDILKGRLEIFSEIHDDPEAALRSAVASGYRDIDHKLGGFKPADFVVVAARPSMGKTAFALSLAQKAAEHKKTVGFLSLEMSKEQLVDRLLASIMHVDSWKLAKGKLADEEWGRIGNAMNTLSGMNLFIDDSAGSSVTEVRAKARRLQMEHGLDMLVVDYLQLMSGTPSQNWAGNRVQEISEISRQLKQLARELRLPIVALSQLSRAVENRPGRIPQLADLRESGAIEQDADVVLMMYREDYYEEHTDRVGITDIYIRKNRNGPVGKVELKFEKSQQAFFDIDTTHVQATPEPSAQKIEGAF